MPIHRRFSTATSAFASSLAFLSLLAAASLTTAPPARAAIDLGRVAPWPHAPGATCTTVCTVIQRTDDGTNTYVAPYAGVITSYWVQAGTSFPGINSVGLRVFRPQPGDAWLLAGKTVDAELAPVPGVVASIPTRIGIIAGDHIGMEVEFDGDTRWHYATGSASDQVLEVTGLAPAVGTVIPLLAFTPIAAARVNVRARLELDSDGDGFGDESQDGCPSDASTQGVCVDRSAPVVTAFKTRYKRFRFKPGGAVISKRAHPGTTISLILSEAAHVRFGVEKGFRGRSVGGACVKPSKKNKTARPCTRYVFVHAFERDMVTGSNSFAYSGRYTSPNNGKTGTLRPGPYRMSATAADAAGNAGSAAPVKFEVRR